MNEVYAALILHEAKKEINEENIKKILEAAGAQVEEAKIKALVAALQGINIDEALRQAVAFQAQPTMVAQEKKEEKKEEEDEAKKRAEEAVAGLSALFG
ncbi:MAG: 50S ribosomal protein P1 [Candidatus Aenigmarchaeota archaeon]|jgi:large subunit ribosomal protein L12|nr:50S ribosomal protein P1 [Candidatus Aenigmarchaeota archaeon]